MYLTPVQYGFSFSKIFNNDIVLLSLCYVFGVCPCIIRVCLWFHFGILFSVCVWVLLMCFPIQNHSKKIMWSSFTSVTLISLVLFIYAYNFWSGISAVYFRANEIKWRVSNLFQIRFQMVHTERKKRAWIFFYILYIIKAIITITRWK